MRGRAIAQAVLAALLLAAPAGAGAEEPELAERLEIAAGGSLRIELDRGRVELATHDASDVRIEARAEGLGAADVRFALEREGEDVVLVGRSEPWLRWLRRGPRVRVRVWLPHGYAVERSAEASGAETSALPTAIRF